GVGVRLSGRHGSCPSTLSCGKDTVGRRAILVQGPSGSRISQDDGRIVFRTSPVPASHIHDRSPRLLERPWRRPAGPGLVIPDPRLYTHEASPLPERPLEGAAVSCTGDTPRARARS